MDADHLALDHDVDAGGGELDDAVVGENDPEGPGVGEEAEELLFDCLSVHDYLVLVEGPIICPDLTCYVY